jgi:hypothetical protein
MNFELGFYGVSNPDILLSALAFPQLAASESQWARRLNAHVTNLIKFCLFCGIF